MSGGLVVVTLVTAGELSSHVVSVREEIVWRLTVVNYVGLKIRVKSEEYDLIDPDLLYH